MNNVMGFSILVPTKLSDPTVGSHFWDPTIELKQRTHTKTHTHTYTHTHTHTHKQCRQEHLCGSLDICRILVLERFFLACLEYWVLREDQSHGCDWYSKHYTIYIVIFKYVIFSTTVVSFCSQKPFSLFPSWFWAVVTWNRRSRFPQTRGLFVIDPPETDWRFVYIVYSDLFNCRVYTNSPTLPFLLIPVVTSEFK